MSPERNLLIEAGAGTGKTTRLVKAVLQALFIRRTPLEAVVALTFTNKAAAELKERIALALEDVLVADRIETLRKKPWWPSPEPLLSLTDLQKLATDATGVLDRANISTIHSYAFALLKRFPLAAGIDPAASIDDKGLKFDELFRREWPQWLAVELAEASPREKPWLDLLSVLTLSEIQAAARDLADFKVPQDHLLVPDTDLATRLKGIHEELRQLSAGHPGTQKADSMARSCEEVIGMAVHGAWDKLNELRPEVLTDLEKDPGAPTKAWDEQALARLEFFLAIANNITRRGDKVISLLTHILEPFVVHFREVLLTEGCLTHSALLYLSREIVKNHPEIRAALKRTVRLILIDEFQDTDPLQAELLLYITEMAGRHAEAWDQVRLEPGKLFIVGDPKQSIYRFRGADIAAYERIGNLLVEQGGIRETLEINYRSQSQIIGLVNKAFERLILPEPEISPLYIAVKPHHMRDPAHAVQDVELWLAGSQDEQTVEQAQATEGEHIARWIKESQGKLTVYDPKEGQRRPLLYRDVALIFRTYSPMDRIIEALRRHDIPYAVESERYFFTTPEVTDFINLLRAAENPDDLLSLIGFLRGSMGGLPDEEILRHRNAGTLEEAGPVRWLRTITARLARRPLAEVLQFIFESTYLMELAARSYHGDQTVANLLKFRRLLENFAAEGVTTMGLLLEKLDEFFNDDKIEGESPLADENYNAVRLLTIHKAKGLEYPVVFLPSLHSELRAHKPEAFIYDWRTQKMGLCVSGFSNLDKLLLDEQTRRREAAEENRILYVAMTRARERLVLSGGVNLKSNRSRTYFQRLLQAWDLSLSTLGVDKIQIEDHSIFVRRFDRVEVYEDGAQGSTGIPLAHVDPDYFAKIWGQRADQCRAAGETPIVLTPSTETRGPWSDENQTDPDVPARVTAHGSRAAAAMLGTLVHHFLERWDFTGEKCSMPAALRHTANTYFAQQGLLRVPFPDPKMGDPVFAPDDPMTELADIIGSAQTILADFIGSEAWEEIKMSDILGREVPFFYGNKPMTRGTMDILYRRPDGKLVIGDYKTGPSAEPLAPSVDDPKSRLGPQPSALGAADRYAAQGAAYREAVRRALGEDAEFKIIPLRTRAEGSLP